MSTPDNKPSNNHRPQSGRPADVDLETMLRDSSLKLPGLEQALALGVVSTTAELKEQLAFTAGISAHKTQEIVELSWRFAQGSTALKSRALAFELCMELRPQGLFSINDVKALIESQPDFHDQISYRVSKMLDITFGETLPSIERHRKLCSDYLDSVLSEPLNAGLINNPKELEQVLMGTVQHPGTQYINSLLDALDLISSFGSNEKLKELASALKVHTVIGARSNASIVADRDLKQTLGSEPITTQDILGFSIAPKNIRTSGGLEQAIDSNYFVNSKPCKTLEEKLLALHFIEARRELSWNGPRLCAELRADLVERWASTRKEIRDTDLKQVLIPSYTQYQLHPQERVNRLSEVLIRLKTPTLGPMIARLREEARPKDDPEFRIRSSANVEVQLFTNAENKWETLTVEEKFARVKRFISQSEDNVTRALAREVWMKIINLHEPAGGWDKNKLEQFLFGEKPKSVGHEQRLSDVLAVLREGKSTKLLNAAWELHSELMIERGSFLRIIKDSKAWRVLSGVMRKLLGD